MITDKRIGVLMGGTSAEREVSLKSGTAVYNAFKGLGYHVVAVDVGPSVCEELRRERIEIAFLVLHGGYGEDGSIQGLLEVQGIPYTGSGVLASALAMDKEATKKVFLYHDIPMPPFAMLRAPKAEAQGLKEDREPITRQISPIDFPLPWVIKPAAEGSSIGVSIVRDDHGLSPAIEKALSFGERVIIEKYIKGKEIQVGILNETILGAVEVRPKHEFYSYEAKYTAGLTEYILPPELDPRILRKAEETALDAHVALGCKGATRVDLIVEDNGNPHVLEVNTIPGMTETSLLPKIAALSGLSFSNLIEEILKDAGAGRLGR
jgi:D-alanine-D-alanine ligase